VSDLDWQVSTRAKRRAGAVRYRDGTPEAVVLTWGQLERAGWAAMAATIRHELAHVHLLVEHDDASHGERFRRLADRLDAPRHCDRFTAPDWWVRCVDCGARIARYRRSKLVTGPDSYRCGDCGGRFRVERNDCPSQHEQDEDSAEYRQHRRIENDTDDERDEFERQQEQLDR